MPLVLKQNGVAIHIYPFGDQPKLIHCFDGNIETEIEVEVELETVLVVGYGASNKLPSGDFLLRALLVVHEHRNELIQSWEEIRS